jgi:aminocarboxymuconate-semialdehyde decarboxylase
MAVYDLPVWMHPHRLASRYPDYAGEEASLYRFNDEMGWPFDTTLFMFRLVFSGIFDRHPNLKVIIHHLGAMIPYFRGRIEHLPGDGKLKREPYEYFRMFYADTATQGSVSQGIVSVMECGIDFYQPDHIVFGTDMPYDAELGTQFPRETIKALESTRYSESAKWRMFEGNAIRLLKL